MALTLEELSNLQRFAPITRPNPQNQGEYFTFIEQGPPSISDIQAATRSSNPYASLMNLTPQQRMPPSYLTPPTAAGSTGGFDPTIYKKLPGLLTQPAAGTGGGAVSGGGGGYDSGSSGGGGGNLGVGPGQGVSSNAQNTALSLISLADKYPAILPGGIFAKVLGLLGGLTADSQTAKMAEAQKAIEAIDKQNAAALESGSSRTFDPYGGTKGVMSVSDKEGNVRSFDPYAGDSAKDADRAAALAASIANAREARDIENAQAAQAQQAAQALQAQRDADAATASRGRDAQADAAAAASGARNFGKESSIPEGGVPSPGVGGEGGGGGMGNSGSGAGTSNGGAQAKGGLITPRDVKGPNPPGPDDGQASLDIGEYVIRKSAVKKYGSNIFEKINAGQIPAKRLKSLLE